MNLPAMQWTNSCWCGEEALEPFHGDYARCLACNTLVCQTPHQGLEQVVDDDNDYYGRQYWQEHQTEKLGLPDIHRRARQDLPGRGLYWLKTLLRHWLPPGRVLEVGCGHGGFTALMNWAGYEAVGLELSPWVQQFAEETFGAPMVRGPLESQDFDDNDFDIIVMLDVLEHLPDPCATLGHCARLLKPDGLLLIQTPCYPAKKTHQTLAEEKNRFPEMLIPREHLYLYSQESVIQLLEQFDFGWQQFEPPLFDYDMFLAASRTPLPGNDDKAVQKALLASPSGRIILAMLDLASERDQFRRQWQVSAQDREAQRSQVQELTSQLEASEADRAARQQQIQELTQHLEETEADRAARFDQIKELTNLLMESEADREARFKQIQELTGWLTESEADRDARFEQIQELTARLKESEADRERHIRQVQQLEAWVKEVKLEQKDKRSQVQELSQIISKLRKR